MWTQSFNWALEHAHLPTVVFRGVGGTVWEVGPCTDLRQALSVEQGPGTSVVSRKLQADTNNSRATTTKRGLGDIKWFLAFLARSTSTGHFLNVCLISPWSLTSLQRASGWLAAASKAMFEGQPTVTWVCVLNLIDSKAITMSHTATSPRECETRKMLTGEPSNTSASETEKPQPLKC